MENGGAAGSMENGGAGGTILGGGGTSSGGALGTGCVFGGDASAAVVTNGASNAANRANDVFTRDASSPDSPDASGPERDGGDGNYPPLDVSKLGAPFAADTPFEFTEGPVWDPKKQVLYFTDINANAIYRLMPPGTFDVFVQPAGNANGLALDASGALIAAGFVSRDVARVEGTTLHPVASIYRGEKLNSPDDLIARSDGTIYFTDPTFGIDGSQGFTSQPAQLCFQGVYRIVVDGSLHLEDQSTSGPNGVELSPDERLLYVSYTNTGEIDSFRVAADGSLSGKTTFARNVTTADSMCIDAAGNLYVASLAGITVLDETGKSLGVIRTSGRVPTNCAFGGSNQRTLFITARVSLAGTPTSGNAALLALENMPIPGIPGRP
jgi:gluconolactonase